MEGAINQAGYASPSRAPCPSINYSLSISFNLILSSILMG